MDLWWDDIPGEWCQLYAGIFDSPIAHLIPSSSGKTHSVLFEIPVGILKKFATKDEMKGLVESRAREFFDLANTSRPAMESKE